MKLTFETALVYAKQGKKIRHGNMSSEWSYVVHNGRLVVERILRIGEQTYVSHLETYLDGGDVLAEDWEVIE